MTRTEPTINEEAIHAWMADWQPDVRVLEPPENLGDYPGITHYPGNGWAFGIHE